MNYIQIKMKQGLPGNNKYKVRIQCSTYNHAKYIEDALRGFSLQQTNFPFVCCVMDDASTDGEQDVLRRWIDNHCNADDVEVYDHPLTIVLMAPDRKNRNCIYAIHLLKYNTWGKPERHELLGHWRKLCEYEALCEGDDYWTDPLKLQKQVDFLESHSDYGLVYTQVEAFDENGIVCPYAGLVSDAKSLLFSNGIVTLTVCVRCELLLNYLNEVKPETKDWLMGDYPMWIWFLYNTKAFFMDEVMGRYRILQNSASHSTNINKTVAFEESALDVKLFFIQKYWPNNHSLIKDVYTKSIWGIFRLYIVNNMDELAFKLFQERYKVLRFKRKIIGLILWHFPFIRNYIRNNWALYIRKFI